jgi:hypothetical protein
MFSSSWGSHLERKLQGHASQLSLDPSLPTRAFLPRMLTLILQYFIFWKHGMKETKV